MSYVHLLLVRSSVAVDKLNPNKAAGKKLNSVWVGLAIIPPERYRNKVNDISLIFLTLVTKQGKHAIRQFTKHPVFEYSVHKKKKKKDSKDSITNKDAGHFTIYSAPSPTLPSF